LTHLAARAQRNGFKTATVRLKPDTTYGFETCSSLATAAQLVTIAALAWGALAFGAVYPWAYWPLIAACCIAGAGGLFVERRAGASRALVLALVFTAAAGLLQVVPLSRETLRQVSPSTPGVIAQLEPAFAIGVRTAHPVSIHPPLTWTSLALLTAFSLLLIGSSRLFSLVGTSAIVRALTVLGVVLALAGIVQKALYNGKVYGFWTTQMGGDPFGPFVNKNHFAGWMLLALPVTLGLVCAGISRGMRGVRPVWRERFLWLSSPEANELMLLLAASAVMALALVMTMSRSGISAMAFALTLTGWFVIRGHSTGTRKAAAGIYLVLLALVVMGWVGVDAVNARFAQADWTDINGRKGTWSDAWHIASLFPLTGTGLNTYGVATLFYQRIDPSAHYAQAHNDYLQLGAEGGLLLTVPAAFGLVLLVRDIRRRLREDRGASAYWIRAGAITGLVAMALQETVEFSLQMPGNAALFAVVCGLALHRSPRRIRD
jgi:O-antigen ligase